MYLFCREHARAHNTRNISGDRGGGKTAAAAAGLAALEAVTISDRKIPMTCMGKSNVE